MKYASAEYQLAEVFVDDDGEVYIDPTNLYLELIKTATQEQHEALDAQYQRQYEKLEKELQSTFQPHKAN